MAHSKFDTVNGKRVKCYDNSGKTIDRYTVVYLDEPQEDWNGEQKRIGATLYAAVALGVYPFHPQGFCQHTDAYIGSHLGKRCPFVSLPPDCRKVVEQDCA